MLGREIQADGLLWRIVPSKQTDRLQFETSIESVETKRESHSRTKKILGIFVSLIVRYRVIRIRLLKKQKNGLAVV